MNFPVSVFLLLLGSDWMATLAAAEQPGALRPTGLRCEYLVDPAEIDEKLPWLSWTGESAQRRQIQNAYQVLVASTAELLTRDRGDRWDSGKVVSDESAHVAYAGQPLASRAACFWKVRL